ncbi:hypothetical protein NKH18_31920 [Streptomyces sp. M10(2022)]
MEPGATAPEGHAGPQPDRLVTPGRLRRILRFALCERGLTPLPRRAGAPALRMHGGA